MLSGPTAIPSRRRESHCRAVLVPALDLMTQGARNYSPGASADPNAEGGSNGQVGPLPLPPGKSIISSTRPYQTSPEREPIWCFLQSMGRNSSYATAVTSVRSAMPAFCGCMSTCKSYVSLRSQSQK